MKLNLPTTLTSQKINALILLGILKATQVKTGSGFENCLLTEYGSFNNYYDSLVSYFNSGSTINSTEILALCCDSANQCFSFSSSSSCNNSIFFCNEISTNVFCVENHINGLCAGLVGDKMITNSTSLGSACLTDNVSAATSYLATIPASSTINNGSKGEFAEWTCQGNSPCANLACNWDNGGWTCHNVNYHATNTSSNCYLQWPAPFPSLVSPTSSSISSSSSNPVNLTSTISSNNPYLIEEIAIPVGVVGIGSLSGLTYYLVKRRKKYQSLKRPVAEKKVESVNQILENELIELPIYEGNNLHQVEEIAKETGSQYQAQIEVNPSRL